MFSINFIILVSSILLCILNANAYVKPLSSLQVTSAANIKAITVSPDPQQGVRVRRSYYYVDDGSDDVHTVENDSLIKALEREHRREHHSHEHHSHEHQSQEHHSQEYGYEGDGYEDHTPFFVPNLFG